MLAKGRSGRLSLGFDAKLSLNEGDNGLYRLEVVRNHILVFHDNCKTLLEKDNQFEDTTGVDHIIQERLIVTQCFAPAKEVVLDEKASDFTLDVCCLHVFDWIRLLVCELCV